MITLTWSEFLLHSGFPGPCFQLFNFPAPGICPLLTVVLSPCMLPRQTKKEVPFAFKLEEFVEELKRNIIGK